MGRSAAPRRSAFAIGLEPMAPRWLSPVRIPMRINETHHHFDRRSSSAIAKYADALRRISFAWRSSRFSRSSAFIFSAISAGMPGRLRCP